MMPANDNDRPAWFDALIVKYQPFIRSKAARLGHGEDLAHDVIERALERWHLFRLDGNIVGWLGYLMRNILEERRRRQRTADRNPFFHQAPAVEPTQGHHVEIIGAIAALPRSEARAVGLLAIGLTGPEVGKVLGVSRQRVWEIANSARQKLRAANDNEQRAA